MTDLVAARFVTSDDLAAWRRRLPRGWQRAVSQPRRQHRPSSPVERVGEDAAAFPLPAIRPQHPGETYRQITPNRLQMLETVRQLRKWQPAMIAHLTDEQAAQMLEERWSRNVSESMSRVYRRQGRAGELTVNLDGTW